MCFKVEEEDGRETKEQGASRLASSRGRREGEGGAGGSAVDGSGHGVCGSGGGDAVSARGRTEAARAAVTSRNGDVAAQRPAAGGGEFDAAAFVREHGKTLAVATDAEGSFIHALFNCLEVRCSVVGATARRSYERERRVKPTAVGRD